MIILDGRKTKEFYTSLLIEKIKKMSFIPCIVILQIGNRADSNSFIKSKKIFAQKIGVKEIHIQLDENIDEKTLIEIINKYNRDKSVNGIIVQLPLPAHLDSEKIINNIDSKKDIDGLTNGSKFIPATARGIKELLKYYNIDLLNKKVTVVGRSNLVGKPVAKMCAGQGAIVNVCHSKTIDLMSETKNSDILIVAIGKPHFFDEKYIKKDQIVIDIGITKDKDIIKGDVDFERVKDLVSMITPVPGGVGQMTVLALFENLVDSCYNIENK